MKKKVLAISGSLRKQSFTEKMLDLLIEGMGDGVEVKKFYPHKMKIGPCNSCWSCWGRKNPGICAQNDDFEEILDAYKEADYFLWAFPLYFFSFPAIVKNVIDRFYILLEPSQIESEGGYTEHPTRFDSHPKTVLISSCGFPETENFHILSQQFKKICTHAKWNWAGEILISATGAVNVPKLFDEKYDLIKKAGQELVEDVIVKETMEQISSPVIGFKDYREMCTARFTRG